MTHYQCVCYFCKPYFGRHKHVLDQITSVIRFEQLLLPVTSCPVNVSSCPRHVLVARGCSSSPLNIDTETSDPVSSSNDSEDKKLTDCSKNAINTERPHPKKFLSSSVLETAAGWLIINNSISSTFAQKTIPFDFEELMESWLCMRDYHVCVIKIAESSAHLHSWLV